MQWINLKERKTAKKMKIMYKFATDGVSLEPTQESPPSKPNGKVDEQIEQSHLEAHDKPL